MTLQNEPIAIIGMAGIFPKAENLNQYWDNILQSVDCIIDIPETHWSIENYFDSNPKAEDKTYCKRGGFIPPIDFNSMEFGLPPNILENIDVAQLLALVVAKRALQDAGYGEINPYASTTGVTLGASALSSSTALTSRLQYPIWEKVLVSAGIASSERQKIIEKIKLAYVPWQEDSFPGYLSNVVAGRIANRLDLGGVNCTVDAACASSMASLQMAIDELVLKRSDMMITGGVDFNNGISAFVSFSKTPAFTQHSHIRPFDNESDGMLIGEGVGMLILRRLTDAKRDGNKIYAVIRGVGSSSDGKHKSIYAPSMQGQELALRRAYSNAGVSPNTVGLIEAHGTGTATGDPAEFSALQSVFGETELAPASIALGSVKSQIGHTKVAAGVAGIIKAALALHHKVLPPTINITKPNTKFNIEQSPFYLNTVARPWFSPTKRRAGISAFGFGGTNFHVVLEEAEAQIENDLASISALHQIILQASSAVQLLELCVAKRAQLQGDSSEKIFFELLESSTNQFLASNDARIGFLINDKNRFLEQLEWAIDRFLEDSSVEEFSLAGEVYYRAKACDASYKVVALFSGQGSQYLEMGKTLCWNHPVVQQTYSAMDSILLANGRAPITDIVFPKPTFDEQQKKQQSELLRRTENTQPAIGTFNLALFKLLQNMGFSPDFVAGHSLGELSALCAAQVIDEKDYLQLLHERGQAMALPQSSEVESGTLLAVNGDIQAIEVLLEQYPRVSIANYNSRIQLVLGGALQDIEQIRKVFAEQKISAIPLPVAGAFHTKFVKHAYEPFSRALQQVSFSHPRVPVYSNSTGRPYPNDSTVMQEMLAQHILNPVNFKQEIEQLYADGARIFIEFGPGNVLTKLVDNILDEQEHNAIALNANKHQNSDRLLQEAILQMRILGISLQIKNESLISPSLKDRKLGMNIQLCGSAYISDKTRQAFDAALVNKNWANKNIESIEVKKMNQTIEQQNSNQSSAAQQREDAPSVHQQYLKNMADHSFQFSQLIQQQYLLLNNPNNSPAALGSFERSIALFHEQQNMMQRVHEQYLVKPVLSAADVKTNVSAIKSAAPSAPNLQTANAVPQSMQSLGAMLNLPTQSIVEAAPIAKPEPVQVASSSPVLDSNDSSVSEIANILLTVVSEKAGYPLDMLDLSMDLDADLGIDSIKRVEILAALEGRVSGNIADLNFEKLAELKTLGQIAQYLGGTEKKNLT